MNEIIKDLLEKKQELLFKIKAIDEVLNIYGYKENSTLPNITFIDKCKPKTIENQLIEKTYMSIRLCNLLKYCGCVYIKDILVFSKSDFLKRRGFGLGMMNELNSFLNTHNLKLLKN